MSTPDPNNPRHKPLVSVQFETEVDLSTGTPERRMFVKMYFDARDSGLLADIGARRWHTLCALATYMDEKGLCYPSQARLSKDLGIHRQRVNERVQELLSYRFQGRPVITVRKARLSTAHGGRWTNNVYQILPVTGFGIFDDAEAEKPRPSSTSANVRKSGHRPMSGKPDTGNPDTNQTPNINQTFNVNALMKGPGTENTTSDPDISIRREALVLAILDVTKDHHSTGFYRLAAATIPENLIYRTLSETKDARARGRIKKNAGAFFTDSLLRLAAQQGIPIDRASVRSA